MMTFDPRADAALGAHSEAPRVSVIIPHYNDLDNLDRCLTLLEAQTAPREFFEVVVADNNSRCGLDAVTRLCGARAIVIPAPIQGAAEARNAAVRASSGAILAFIDSDCRPSPSWLEEGVKALNGADVIGGQVDVDYETPGHPSAVEAFEKVFAFDFKKYVEKDKFSGSGNMFVRRAVFDAVGTFRPGLSEDREWGNRAVSKGFSLKYAPSAVVSHPARRDWPELKGKWIRIVEQTYLFQKAAGRSRFAWLLYCLVVFASPAPHLVRILGSDKISGARLKLSAIFVLFRLRWFRAMHGLRLLMQ